MNRYGMTRADAVARPCIACGAMPGRDCTAVNVVGVRSFVHEERYYVAFRNSEKGRDWCDACHGAGCPICGR
jgi:hypothetical protein